MNLQEFCFDYRMPLSKTNRSVRDLALRALAEGHDLPPEKREEIDLREHGIDKEVGGFLYVRKPEGQKRFSYEVTEPKELARWLRKRHGADLLTDKDISVLLEFAVRYREAAYGEGKWVLRTKDGDTLDLTYERFRKLEQVLRKAGRIEQA